MTLVLLTAPLREEFGRRNTSDHTQMGTVSNAIDYANGFQCPDFLRGVGFERRFGDAASLEEQNAINRAEGKHAGRALSYAWRLAKGLICTSLHYSETPPDALASLISPSEEIRARGLRLAKDFCKIMRRADSEARGNEFIVGVYSSWVWPRMQWVREQLVSLAEFDFEVIPPDVETACYAKWRGYQQTVIVEDGFNVLENATRETKPCPQQDVAVVAARVQPGPELRPRRCQSAIRCGSLRDGVDEHVLLGEGPGLLDGERQAREAVVARVELAIARKLGLGRGVAPRAAMCRRRLE